MYICFEIRSDDLDILSQLPATIAFGSSFALHNRHTVLVRLLAEHGTDLFDGLVLSFGHLLPGEPGEESQESGKDEEYVGTDGFLLRQKNMMQLSFK